MAGPNPFLQSPFQSLIDDQVKPLQGVQQATEVDTPDLSKDAAPTPAPAPEEAPAPAAPPPQPAAPPASLLPPKQLQPLFEATAAHFKVPVNVLMAIAQQESSYNPDAVNKETGAAGMGQYLDSTAKSLGINPHDPNEAVPAIAQQLRERLDKGYSMADAIKEHFAGPDRKLWGDKTAAYGDEVLAKAGQIGQQLYGDTSDAPAPAAPSFTPGAEQNQFSPLRMNRADYEKEFRALNPKAPQTAVDAAMAQYDQQAAAKTQAAGNRVQNQFAALQSPEAMFNQRLDAKLQAGNQGVAQALPNRQQPDSFPETGSPDDQPSTIETVGGNLTGGALGTLVGAIASGAKLVGADDTAKEFSEGLEQIRGRQKELGGDTFAGKVANLVGGIVPALAEAPEYKVLEFAKNAGLFGIPAFQETYQAKLAAGQSNKLALVHAFESFGMNTLAPMVMQHGVGAVIGKLGAEGAAGVKGAALGLGQAAGEGVAFSGANSVMDKGTDVLAGQQNDNPWIDPEDMAVQAAGFGALRGAHMVPEAARAVADRISQARVDTGPLSAALESAASRPERIEPTLTDVPEEQQPAVDPVAIARADAVRTAGGSVADQLRAIRNPDEDPFSTEPAPGPMTAAIERAADLHAVDPAPMPAVEPEPPALDTLPMDDLRAKLRDVAQQVKGAADPAQRKQLMQQRGEIEKAIASVGKQALADSKPVEEPLSAGPFEDMKAANRMMQRYAEETGQPHEVVGSEGKFRIQPIEGTRDGIDTAGTGTGTDGRGRSGGPADEVGGDLAAGRAGTGTGVIEGERDGSGLPAEKRGADAGDYRTGADGTADAQPALKADATDSVQALIDRLQPQADRLTDLRNEAVRKFNEAKAAKDEPTMLAMKDRIDGFDAQRRQIQHQIFLEGQRQEAARRSAANSETYGKMDVGTKIGMIGHEGSDDTYFQKVGPNRWQRTMGGRIDDVFKTDANMEGKRVIPSKETANVPERPQVPEEAPPARGAQSEKPAGANTAERAGARAPAVEAIAGKKIDDDWTAFAKQSGSLNIPRADMPQVKAEHRGALVNFLAARGIEHHQEEVPASSLKPTQREFSPAKVDKAAAHEGGDRSILVSSDGHVLDGHHQWLTKLADDAPVNVIRLDAPIKDLLEQVKEFPSVEAASGASATKPEGKLAARRALNDKQDAVVRAAAEKLAARKAERDAAPQPAAEEAPAPTPEPAAPAREVPKSFMKKVKVDHDVYIRDERRWESVKVPADKALASVREDITNLEALLNCMKG